MREVGRGSATAVGGVSGAGKVGTVRWGQWAGGKVVGKRGGACTGTERRRAGCGTGSTPGPRCMGKAAVVRNAAAVRASARR